MQAAGLKAELWGFSRAVKADVEELVRLGLRASVIEAPTSDIKLKAYGLTRDEVLRRVTDAVSFAKQNGITVAFFAVDGTRTGSRIPEEDLHGGARSRCAGNRRGRYHWRLRSGGRRVPGAGSLRVGRTAGSSPLSRAQ